MPGRLCVLILLSAASLLGGHVQLLTSLPDGPVSRAIRLDSAGAIYVAGYLTPPTPKSPDDTRDAFIAKLSPDGSALVYFTVLSGSSDDAASALVLGADGSAFVAGYTKSPDFPVTAAAMQSSFGASSMDKGFLAKLDPAGNVVYATFIGGNVSTLATGVTANSAGEIFVTGSGGTGGGPGGFLLKFDATLSNVLLSINGYGGGQVALDNQGNIYLAGAAFAGTVGDQLPALSPGAFQPTHASRFCFESSGVSGFALDCSYQYIAKFDSTGTNLLWATYLTGSYGATAEGMAVDDAGNVIVAGTTNSPDYPVTPGAFQTTYAPAGPIPPDFGLFPAVNAPFPTGFVTKLNSTGTGLVWSSYFGGSYADHVTGMAIGASGEIYLSGRAGSNDLPILSATPYPCRPQANQVIAFVARIASDGATAAESQLVYGAPACLYSSCTSTVAGSDFTGWPLALRTDGTAVVGGVNGNLASLDFSSDSRLACVGDAGDRAQLGSVTPGQLISVFGADLAPASPYKAPASVTESTDSFGVFFNGIPAPILYSSTGQINVQVPYEIAGQTSVQMQVINNLLADAVSETATLGVAERRPSVFLADPVVESPVPGFSVCGTTLMLGIAPVALNADGTQNDCTNPAMAGSTVSIFVNGLGVTSPTLTTGAIASAPPVQLSPAFSVAVPGSAASPAITTTVPGSIAGVAQVQVQLPETVGAVQALLLQLEGSALPEQPLIIWTLPN